MSEISEISETQGIKIIRKIIHNAFVIAKGDKELLATKSRYSTHYGERKYGELREWIPYRSKFAAVLLKGYSIEIPPDCKMLYLGAASGTTVSHVADIVDQGIIYAVEYSAKPFSKFLELATERENIIPLLEDASKPWRYSGIVEEVDFIYQDISQKEQIGIFKLNSEYFLKKGGEGLIMVKARSIDSTTEPQEIYESVLDEIASSFEIKAYGSLEPYHRDHIFIHTVK